MYESNSRRRVADWFVEWRQPLRRFIAGRRTIPPKDLDDVAQEVFLRLLRYDRAEFVEYPQAYLFRIAANVTLEWALRSRNANVREMAWAADRANFDMTDGEMNPGEDEEELEQALLSLGNREREILRLQYFEELSHAQIAERLGITERVVKRTLAKGYQCLRRNLVRPHI